MSQKFNKINSDNIKLAQTSGSGTGGIPGGGVPGAGMPPPGSITSIFDANAQQPEKKPGAKMVRPKESAVTGVIEKIMEKAGLSGSNAEAFRQRILERSDIIDEMMGQISEDLIAKYFDEFLFKKSIPEDVTYNLMLYALICK